ncbi:hypothetical protein [Methylorubrum aminovorans]|uniref:hypothetical protein n=1 Tax=Methylorubrum aminovorans TaxID=269069 RepID=UPI003C2D41D4
MPGCGMPEHFHTLHAPPYRHLTGHRLRDAFADRRVQEARHQALNFMRRDRPGPAGYVVRDSDGRDLGVLVRCRGMQIAVGMVHTRHWVIVPVEGRPPRGVFNGLATAAAHLALLVAQAPMLAERRRRVEEARLDPPMDPFDAEALAGLTHS